MKKVLFSLLLVPILLAVGGAAPETSEATSGILKHRVPNPAVTRKVWTYKDMVVGLLQMNGEDGWRVANTASFRDTAMKLGITLKMAGDTDQATPQQVPFRGFIADKAVNVIVLAALYPTGWEDMLREARAAGKIVIVENRPIDAPEDLYTTYVGSDFVEEGRRAAVAMCELLKDMPRKNVWELVGNSSAARDRGKGFHQQMGECGIQITRSEIANWNTTEGKQMTKAWLKETHDVQGIFAQNDDMGLGAIQALKEAGLKPGVDIKIVSVDATAGAFRAMVAGDLNVTVEHNPLLAPQVYAAALKALNGESLPKWIPAHQGVFYAKDAATILPTRKY